MTRCNYILLRLLALALPLLSGCTTNNLTGSSQLTLLNEQFVIDRSAVEYRKLISKFEKEGKLNNDEQLKKRVQKITERLVSQAILLRPETKSWNWTVNVIDDPKVINAFCMAGGKMVVYTGLIEQLNPSNAELAMLMGHEVSHALANHLTEKLSLSLASNLTVATLTKASSEGNTQYDLKRNSDLALMLVKLPNSRAQEQEADRLGVKLAAMAGYNPRAAATLLRKLMEATGNNSSFDWLSTHPATPTRIQDVEELEIRMAPFYEDNKEYSVTRKLRQLHSLNNAGTMSDEYYQQRKRELLEEF